MGLYVYSWDGHVLGSSPVQTLPVIAGVYAVSWSPTGQNLAVGTWGLLPMNYMFIHGMDNHLVPVQLNHHRPLHMSGQFLGAQTDKI